jgi:hypothetical protein
MMTPDDAEPSGCQEAALGLPFYLPCNEPAVSIVGWLGKSEGPYRMCAACTDHNVKNRGAMVLGPFVAGGRQ